MYTILKIAILLTFTTLESCEKDVVDPTVDSADFYGAGVPNIYFEYIKL